MTLLQNFTGDRAKIAIVDWDIMHFEDFCKKYDINYQVLRTQDIINELKVGLK